MHPLDIISESPNLFIFKKESNKTNFGGFLFLIYLIIIILIFIYYLINYIEGDKYIVQSFSHFNIRSYNEIRKRNENINYNPNITFKLDIRDAENILDINKFKLLSHHNDSLLNRNTTFKVRVSNFDLDILYECENYNCTSYNEYMERYGLLLDLEYDGFYLDHQNKYKPIIKREDNESLIFSEEFLFNYSCSTFLDIQWRNILYTEKKFFTNDYNDSCGYIENYKIKSVGSASPIIHNSKIYKIIGVVRIFNENTFYTEYNRKRISEFDVLANILSLISNLYFGARMILKYYSKNFNNYKIIEKLLDHNIKINTQTSGILKEDKVNEDMNNKKDKFNNNIDDNNLIQDINDSEKDDDFLIESNVKLKKFHFYEFFLNNLYCCFKKKIRQKLIHICNKIVYKYAAIDLIIKNQILIENFLKDYKWNDPKLNNIENNDLFIKLKTYL